MRFEAFLQDYRGLLALLSVLAVANVLAAHRALVRLSQARPALLAAAGIRRIDWWPRCVLGIARLGFTARGRDLPLRTRLHLQGAAVSYGVLLALFAKAAFDLTRLLLAR